MNKDTKYLWTINNDLAHDVLRLKGEVRNLKAENAELVDMLKELYWCSHQLGCDRCTSRECCVVLNRMRELGIEVDR